ncbi:MAG: SDR family oxidoreductase, partial [Vulcanimicrobiaceae bacterium]
KIRINTVAPGMVETEGLHAIGAVGSDFQKSMIAQTPLGRTAQPTDIAPVVRFLASDDAGWLTGERISASGGMH